MGAQQYFVRFTDQNGKVLVDDSGKGEWFGISDPAFKLEQTLAIGSLAGTVGAGKVTFDDLSLTLGSSNLTQNIDKALKAGLAFKTIEIVGYGQDGMSDVKVSSTVFKTAGATGDHIDPLTGAHAFTFGYGAVVESVATFDKTGTPIGAITAGWDRVKNIADNDATFDAKEHPGDAILKGQPTAKIVAPSVADHDVYLQIRTLKGGTLPELGTKWIKVDAAVFGDLQTLAIGATSTGLGAGKVAFDDLKLSFNPGTLSPVLDQLMAKGEPLQIELAVYTKTDTGSVLSDDYQFGLAAIKEHTFSEGQHTYSFAYGSERTLHTAIGPTGTIGKSVVEGWDVIQNISLTTPGGTPSAFDAQQAPASIDKLTPFTGGRGAAHYYVRFVGFDNKPLTGDDHKSEWFEVIDPNYGGAQVLNLGGSGGSGAGKVTFNPLNFALGSSSATELLDQQLASGKTIKTIELVGYGDDGQKPIKVSEAVFKTAAVASDEIDPTSGAHHLSFEYGGLVESQATFDALGQATEAVTAGWDRSKNTQDNTTDFDAKVRATDPFYAGKPTDNGPSGGPNITDHQVYLQIRNQDGSPLAGLGTQWIAVDTALFSQMQMINFGAVSSGVNKVTFDPLYLSFLPRWLEPTLSQALAQGKPLQIELAAYHTNPFDDTSVLTDDYQFGFAGLSAHEQSGNSHFYELQYGSVHIVHRVFDNNGVFVRADVEGWDRVRNIELLSPDNKGASFDQQHAPTDRGALSVFGVDKPITIVSEDFSPSSETLFEGDTVSFTLNTSEAVIAAGSYLQLSNGATAVFDPDQSSGTSLVYIYTVNAGDTGTSDLLATGVVGSITSSVGHLLESSSFTAIDTGDADIPNDPGPTNTPAIIGGKLSGKVTVNGIDTATGKLVATDPDAGEAGVQPLSVDGSFGTFTIDTSGNWQYHLTNPAAAAVAKATGQPLAESFSVGSIDGSTSVDVVVNVVMGAHPGSLAFTGTANADILYGGGDGDTLTGLGGDDMLYGLGGDDTLIGGPGDDRLDGSGGIDTASYADADGSVKVSLGISGPQDTGGGGTDTLVRIENLIGSGFADTLTGNSLVNHLFGGAGDDFLNGGLNADIMEGGADNDTYRVDNTGDKVVEGLNAGTADTVRSSVTYTLSDNVETMVLIGLNKIDGTGNALANSLFGNSADNTLVGLAGKDKLSGGAGNDTLSGGADADLLTGGAGKDVFLFDTAPIKGQQDKILDFSLGDDTIHLSRSAFGAFSGHAASQLSAADISFGTKATADTQHLIYNALKGALYYDDDDSGSHAAVLIATISGNPALSLGDFALV